MPRNEESDSSDAEVSKKGVGAIPDVVGEDFDLEEDEEEAEAEEVEAHPRKDAAAKRTLKRIRERMVLEEPKRSIQEQPFNNLMVIIMNLLSSTQPRQYVNLYVFIKILAKRLKEEKMVLELNKMFAGIEIVGENTKTYKVPLSILQFVYDRDNMLGYSPTKTYQKRQITLGGIIIALDGAKERLLDYYMVLCEEHNLPLEQAAQPPQFGGINADELPDVEGDVF